jgi:hypothetical protein
MLEGLDLAELIRLGRLIDQLGLSYSQDDLESALRILRAATSAYGRRLEIVKRGETS